MFSVLFGIGLNTWKQLVRDKVFYVVLLVAMMVLGFAYLLGMLTAVESRKILLDFGFSAVSLAGVATAIYIGIASFAREIEQRTIYTVVSKPISRSLFVVGKFFGSLVVLAVAHALLSLNLLLVLFLMGEGVPSGFAACNFLMFLESSLLLTFALFCSTFTSSSLLAAGFTVAFFLVGRSSNSFKTMADKAITGAAHALTNFLYHVAPNLERFNLRDVVAYGRSYPDGMIAYGTLYAAAYVIACLAASCLLLERRDLP